MNTLPKTILQQARSLPEGGVLSPKEFLHLGSRSAVDQAFSRLAKTGKLLRVARGAYAAPVFSRFGSRAPAPEKIVKALANKAAKSSCRRCQRGQCPGADAASAHPRGLSNLRPYPEAEARALGSADQARTALDAGTGHAAGRRSRACTGLDRAHARRQVAGVAASHPSQLRMASAGLGTCNVARLDGAGHRRGSRA